MTKIEMNALRNQEKINDFKKVFSFIYPEFNLTLDDYEILKVIRISRNIRNAVDKTSNLYYK